MSTAVKGQSGSRPPQSLLPWPELMQLGLGNLRLSPRDFWQLTPRELYAALGKITTAVEASAMPPERAVLEDLMRAHPDQPGTAPEWSKRDGNR